MLGTIHYFNKKIYVYFWWQRHAWLCLREIFEVIYLFWLQYDLLNIWILFTLIITLNIIMLKNLYIFSFQLMAFVGDPPDRICLWQRNLASRNYTESKDVNKEVSLVLVCAQYFKIHQMIKNSWNHFSQNKILRKEAKVINLLLKIFSNR